MASKMADDEQQVGGGQQVFAGHRPVRAAVGEQPGDQVIAWLAVTGIDEVAEVLAEFGVDLLPLARPCATGPSGNAVAVAFRRIRALCAEIGLGEISAESSS